MQGDYAAIAGEAATALQPGRLAAMDAQLAETLQDLADVVQELQHHRAVDQVQHAAQALQQLEQAEQEQQQQQLAAEPLAHVPSFEERLEHDQLDLESARFSGVFTANKLSPSKLPAGSSAGPAATGSSPGRAARKKRQGRAARQRSPGSAPGAGHSGHGPGSTSGEQPAGVTPLMQKLEGMQAVQEAQIAAARYNTHRCLQAWGACELDVRQWLLAGVMEALQHDTSALVMRCRYAGCLSCRQPEQHQIVAWPS